MIAARGLARCILRTASRARASAAAVTVQVLSTITSAWRNSGSGASPLAARAARMAEASASVARQPKFSMKKRGIWTVPVTGAKIIAWNAERRSVRGGAALIAEQNQVRAAANAEFGEQVRDVELHRALGDVQAVGHFLVCEIFEEAAEDFLLSLAQFGGRVGAKAAALRGVENRIHEARKHGSRHPDAAGGDLRQGAGQLLACIGVGEDALHALAQQGVDFGLPELIADDHYASGGPLIENVAQQGASGLPRCVRVHNVDGGARDFDASQIGREGGIELLGGNLKAGVVQQTPELLQNHRVRGEQTHF